MAGGEVRTDLPRCRWPLSGWEGNLRHAVVDNIVINKSRTHYLLIFRSEGEEEGGMWALPGGYIDPGKTAVETVEAETAEEAGVRRIGSLALFCVVDNPNRYKETAGNITFVFVSEVDDPEEYGDVIVDDPDGGTQRARWFPIGGRPRGDAMAFDHDLLLDAFEADPTTYPLKIFMSRYPTEPNISTPR